MPTRAIGLIPLGVGVLGLLATVETSSGTEYSWIDWAFGPALIGIGLGLLFSQRWAWALALLAGAGGIVLGVLAATSPGDIAAPGAQIVGVVVFLLPGLVLLGTLLQPRTLRWLRQPRARDESRVRYFE
jgi:hypothetical protein